MSKEYKYKSLTSKQIEEELKREVYHFKYINVLKSTLYVLIVIAAVSTLIASFIVTVLEVNGSSMEPTLKDGQMIIAFKDNSIEQGDVIAFYQGNKILVKRVIATQGKFVNIDDEGNVYVDGNLIEESYVTEKVLGNSDIEYPVQVPDGQYFVLGDKRDTSTDSRTSIVGTISKKDILGKVVFGIWPLGEIGFIK